MRMTSYARPRDQLRISHLARLGDMAIVDLRSVLRDPPIPTPQPDGIDYRGPFWSLAREHEWRAWFDRYRALPQSSPPWWR